MNRSRLLLPVALTLLALGTLLGCGRGDVTTPARYAFTMNLTGMGPHLGHTFYLRIWHADTGNEVARTEVEPVVTTAFSVNVPDTLILGERYYVDFWADVNMNDKYDAPPTDHAWRRVIGPVAGDTVLNFTHDTNWTDIQWPDEP
jgi:hypothetical protein